MIDDISTGLLYTPFICNLFSYYSRALSVFLILLYSRCRFAEARKDAENAMKIDHRYAKALYRLGQASLVC